jgi:acetylornithine deacetylase
LTARSRAAVCNIYKEYFVAITIDRDFLHRTLSSLVSINSINPTLVPGGAGEREIAEFTAASLRGIGLEAAICETEPGRPSVVGILRGSGSGRSLMLNAHYDTVGVEGMIEPFSAVIHEGRLYGRGAYDMKGSLAACMAAAKAIVDTGLTLGGDLLVAAVSDEEYASLGTTDLISRYQVNGAIVTEPTELEICLAHKGFVWLEVETIGRAAHGSRFDLGVDANMRMGRFLSELEKLTPAGRATVTTRGNGQRRHGVKRLCGSLPAPGRAADNSWGNRDTGRRRAAGDHRPAGETGSDLPGVGEVLLHARTF